MLIAIEGVDGAGKRTLAEGLRKAFEAAGQSVATLAFPRYGRSVTADIAAEALHGEHGDLASSVYAMAMLFALDRAAAVGDIEGLRRDHDVVIMDRYVASNAAYTAARLHQDADGPAVAWVHTLEYGRLKLPAPDRQVLLAVSAEQLRTRRRAAATHRRGVRAAGRRGLGRCLAGRRRGRRPGPAGRRFGGRIAQICHDSAVSEKKRPCGAPILSRSGDTMDSMRQRILVVDDDASLAEMLTIVLRGEGFDTAVIGDGTQALTAVRELRPDLVLLDLMLPGMNGIDVCRVLRADSGVPIVMLTAKTDTVDVVLGLESGADDYIMKPFKPKELVARVRARLRRNDDEPAEMLSIADVEIDVPAHKVTRNGEQISLTPLEFDLLVALARKPRQVFTRDVLLEQVWGYRHPADTRLVNVHVQRLRAKVEKDPENPTVVLTVRGVGYKAGPP